MLVAGDDDDDDDNFLIRLNLHITVIQLLFCISTRFNKVTEILLDTGYYLGIYTYYYKYKSPVDRDFKIN